MKTKLLKAGFLATIVAMSLVACSSDDDTTEGAIEEEGVIEEGGEMVEESEIEIDDTTDLFELSGFIEGNVTINVVEQTLSNGEVADVYEITASNSTSIPVEHDMGPWCPTSVDQNDDTDGGIWLDNGVLYQVTGDFLVDLPNFYDDSTWNLIEEDGVTIKYIDTREGCELAARPDVDPEFQNHCVQCLPEWFEDDDLTATYYIPVNPVKLETSTIPNGERGIALNGVVFDGPAPVADILSAYTIAAFDNAGGHVNPFVGYHYHTATGMSTKIDQEDDHTGMIGYALDGFGIYEYTADANGDDLDLADLDDCRGHEDDVRGYHYHISAPGINEHIPCFSGAIVQGDDEGQGGPGGPGGPPM